MKTLTFLLFCLPFSAKAITTLEEGLILQQELNFLEEVSARAVNVNTDSPAREELDSSNDLSLESTYFGESNEDTVRTRSAAPRRRAP